MATLTEDARSAYEEYIGSVRVCLATAGTASPEEVIADVRQHVDRELEGLGEPVSEPALREVLTRLGQPRQWIAEEDLPWWRRALLRVRTGPEDWRLTYATIGTVLLGVIFGWLFCHTRTWPHGTSHDFNWEALAVFLVVSFILARAAVAAAAKGRGLSECQKWLVYPSLLPVYVLLAATIVGWAPLVAGGLGFEISEHSLRDAADAGQVVVGYYPFAWLEDLVRGDTDVQAGIFAAWAATMGAGIWWTLVGLLLLLKRPRGMIVAVFSPFLKRLSRRWAVRTIAVGLLLAGLGIAAAIVAHKWNQSYF